MAGFVGFATVVESLWGPSLCKCRYTPVAHVEFGLSLGINTFGFEQRRALPLVPKTFLVARKNGLAPVVFLEVAAF